MTHKKQPWEHILSTIKWNTDRGNTPDTLDLPLEISMLQEELEEFKQAVQTNDKVEMFDALLDLKFVLTGTLSKLGISAEQQVDGYEVVLRANQAKSATKSSNGKITKPADFVEPQEKLANILSSRR